MGPIGASPEVAPPIDWPPCPQFRGTRGRGACVSPELGGVGRPRPRSAPASGRSWRWPWCCACSTRCSRRRGRRRSTTTRCSSTSCRRSWRTGRGSSTHCSSVSGESAAHGAHPPLYPVVLTGLAELGGTGQLVQRLTGTLFGAGTVVAIGLIGRRLAGARCGLIAAGIAAVPTDPDHGRRRPDERVHVQPAGSRHPAGGVSADRDPSDRSCDRLRHAPGAGGPDPRRGAPPLRPAPDPAGPTTGRRDGWPA